MMKQFYKRKHFDKFDGEQPYDHSSIMHYKSTAFSKNEKLETIGFRNKNLTKTPVPYRYITDLDVQKTAEMYKCPTGIVLSLFVTTLSLFVTLLCLFEGASGTVVVHVSLTTVTRVRLRLRAISHLIKVTFVTCMKSVVQFDSTKHCRFSPALRFPPVVTLNP